MEERGEDGAQARTEGVNPQARVQEMRETALSDQPMTPLPTITPLKCAALSKEPEFSGNLRLILQSRRLPSPRQQVRQLVAHSPREEEEERQEAQARQVSVPVSSETKRVGASERVCQVSHSVTDGKRKTAE